MPTPFEATRVDAMAAAQELIDSGQLENQLSHLVTLRSESQNPAQAAVLGQYLRLIIRPILLDMGFDASVHDNPIPDAPPLLLASRLETSDLPTILIYGHGDVIHGQDAQWDEGLSPFAAVIRNGMMFGRGTADNKGQHLINFMALKTLIDLRGSLGFNVKVLIEMGEETGSPGLAEFCVAQRGALAADVLIASDGPRLMAEVPTVFMGSRGAVNFDLKVHLRDRAHHSGNWGGLLTDPATILVQALASLTDNRGQLVIPEWRPTSLTPDIRAVLAQLPAETGDVEAVDHDWGEAGLTATEPPPTKVEGFSGLERLRRTVGSFPTEVGGFKPDFWKMNGSSDGIHSQYWR
jgi:acetylornithine deacetylase/succinyl-diaminopimelate desuccinylase-like protein